METSSIPCYEAVKRCWRRRRYQRLPNGNAGRRRLKIVRLGGGDGRRTTTTGRTRLRLKISALSPIRLLARFHDAYVEMMMRLACGVARCRSTAAGKRVCKESQVVSLGSTGEEVDQRLVLEVYRKLAASRQLIEL